MAASVTCFMAGLILMILGVFGGYTAKAYALEGESNKENSAIFFALGLSIVGALLWRIA